VSWRNDTVTTEDSVAMPGAVSGRTLRDAFWTDIEALTFGLVRATDNSLRLGPFELIRLGPAKVTRTGVQWPIQGGLLARAPGGRLRFERLYGRLVSSLDGYEPALPRLLYVLTQLPVHRLWTRLHLLRVRGSEPRPGVPADPTRRLAAAAIDAAFCVALSAAVARRQRIALLLGVTVGYHVACWTISGTTLGGALMHQRVVAGDGSNVSAGQALLRLAALPFGVWRRTIHDEIAGTDVVAR
jgi:hypothetical protein